MRLDEQDDPFNLAQYSFVAPYSKQQQTLSKIYQEPLIPDQPIESFLQRIAIKRSAIYCINNFKYPYARAHNYHFDLNKFERIPNQPTYAIDWANSFHSTFKQEDKLYNGVRLGQIINRVAFTLPLRNTEDSYFQHKKPGRAQNQAHRLLFSNEDEKYEVDREIMTFRQILKNLERMSISDLQQYQLVNRNTSLLFLLSLQVSLQQKKQRLSKIIAHLETLKKFKCQSWQTNDYLYFYSSVQQKLHDYIEQQQKIMNRKQSQLILHYESKYKQMASRLRLDGEAFNYTLQKMLSFYKTSIPCISDRKIDQMQAYAIFLREKVELPLFIFHFGKEDLRKSVDTFLINYARNFEPENEDNISMAISSFFRHQCLDKQLQTLSFSDAKKTTIKVIEELKKQMEEKGSDGHYPVLDQYSKLEQLVASVEQEQQQQKHPFFKFGDDKIQMSQEEVKSLLYYNRICKIFVHLQPILYQNNQLLQILCSPYFNYLNHAFIGHISRKIIVKLKDYTQHLIRNVQSPLALYVGQSTRFQFEFNQENGVGVIWPRKESKKQDRGKDLTYFIKLYKQKYQQNNKDREIIDEDEQDQEQIQRIEGYPFNKRVKQNEQSQS